MKGYQPILAHPERYPYYFHQDKSHIEQAKAHKGACYSAT
jgi:tyrosine-protein phosphatase YwqE